MEAEETEPINEGKENCLWRWNDVRFDVEESHGSRPRDDSERDGPERVHCEQQSGRLGATAPRRSSNGLHVTHDGSSLRNSCIEQLHGGPAVAVGRACTGDEYLARTDWG